MVVFAVWGEPRLNTQRRFTICDRLRCGGGGGSASASGRLRPCAGWGWDRAAAAGARFPLRLLSGCSLDRLGDDSPLLALDRGGSRAGPCPGGTIGHAQKETARRSLHARSPVSRKRLPRRNVQAQGDAPRTHEGWALMARL